MSQRDAQSVSNRQQSYQPAAHSGSTEMQIFLLLTAASLVGLGVAGRHQGDFAGPQIKGGIGNGYIYPLPHRSAAQSSSVRTYKLIVKQAPHSSNAISGGQQQSLVKILKIVEAPGQHSALGPSGYGQAAPIETIKLIHFKGQSHWPYSAAPPPPPAPSYQIDLPASPASQWY